MPERHIIEGRPARVVVDIQQGDVDSDADDSADRVNDGILAMRGCVERISRTRRLVDVAHETAVPIVFFKEIHRLDHIDVGRELDGAPEAMEHLQTGARCSLEDMIGAICARGAGHNAPAGRSG